MKLAVDVMGFENDVSCAIKACSDFAKKNNVEILLVGDSEQISPYIKTKDTRLQIVDCKDFITQEDTLFTLRSKKNTSMHTALDLVLEGKADGVLSAGNSAVYVFLSYQKFGLIDGIRKPGFMAYLPSFGKRGFNLLDVGASKEVDEYDLYMFGIMANIYCPSRGVDHPSIKVLNIGTEKHKGFERHIKVDEMLSANKKINYQGFVEPKELLNGVCDVVLTDGYSGNICLKSLEGSVKTVFKNLISHYKNPLTAWCFPFIAPNLLRMKKKFDYKNNAGAFVLGLNHIAVKTHGSADYKQFYSALRMLKESIDANIIQKIKKEVKHEQERMNRQSQGNS